MKTFLTLILVAIIAYVIYAVACTIQCAKLDAKNKKLREEMDRKYGGINNDDR